MNAGAVRRTIIDWSLTRQPRGEGAGAVVVVDRRLHERGARGVVHPDHGRALWAKLHRRGLEREGCEDAVWLAAFTREVPCGACKVHWSGMLKATPPDWSRYFAWTVERHNEVNRRLGKPEVSEAAARSLWHEAGDALASPPQRP